MTSVLKVDNIQNSSGTSALSIDSSGNVTFPSNTTPYVQVSMGGGSGAYTSVTSGGAFPFDTVEEGDSSLWNTTTYKFTCPSAGLYHCDFNGLVNTSDNCVIFLLKNGTSYARFYHNADRYFHGNIITRCSANDVLHFETANDRSFWDGTGGANLYTFATFTRVGD